MRYLWQHIEHILSVYDGKLPLHHFLKGYFGQHKKLGSRDRRGLSDAAYAFYRAGKALESYTYGLEGRVLAALYLCGLQPKAFAARLAQDFPGEELFSERAKGLQRQAWNIDLRQIFHYDAPFSEGVDKDEWRASMLRQPRLFLRVRRPQHLVDSELLSAGIKGSWPSETCLALPNGTPVENLLPDDWYVVQDASSQQTGSWLHPQPQERWWDCCSGAGGKSLMLLDAAPGLHLTATDIRESILQNLAQRFRKYGHKVPEHFVLDIAAEPALQRLGNRRFDGIICDVPCTGSGTWARTPEGCYFFNPAVLEAYTSRQKSILRNAAKYMKEDGRLFYITCSVFRAENEEVLAEVAPGAGLRIVRSELINGIDIAADSLFIAELRRSDRS